MGEATQGVNWERFDGDLAGYLAYVDKARTTSRPVADAASACATGRKRAARAASWCPH